MENRIDSYPHWPLDEFAPQTAGRIDRIYVHWSAHDYESVYPAYHFCVARRAGRIIVANTHEVRENMRDVYSGPDLPYAQHTRKRNSFALGISVMAMENATPQDFGRYPLTPKLIDALCMVGGRLAAFYSVPIDGEHIMTHAEAALHDGYFGTAEGQRWDIARLEPSSQPLREREAIDVGEALRSKMRRFQEARK